MTDGVARASGVSGEGSGLSRTLPRAFYLNAPGPGLKSPLGSQDLIPDVGSLLTVRCKTCASALSYEGMEASSCWSKLPAAWLPCCPVTELVSHRSQASAP